MHLLPVLCAVALTVPFSPAAAATDPPYRLDGQCDYVRSAPFGVLAGRAVADGPEPAVSTFVRCEIVMPDSTFTVEAWQAGPVAVVTATKLFEPQEHVLICETFAALWRDGTAFTTERHCHM